MKINKEKHRKFWTPTMVVLGAIVTLSHLPLFGPLAMSVRAFLFTLYMLEVYGSEAALNDAPDAEPEFLDYFIGTLGSISVVVFAFLGVGIGLIDALDGAIPWAAFLFEWSSAFRSWFFWFL